MFLSLYSLSHCDERYETGDIDFKFKAGETYDKSVLTEILVLPREKYFNRINLEEDRQRLAKFYFDNGFFDVIVDTLTEINEDQINVTFTIFENSRYVIREFQIIGLEGIPEKLKEEINRSEINAGKPYSKSFVNSEKDRILNILWNNGYYYARIDTSRSLIDSSRRGVIVGKYSDDLQQNPEFKNKVLVRMRFTGADRVYYFGESEITINNNRYGFSKDIVIRELKFKGGEIFDKSKIAESERNFTKLPIIQLGRIITVDPDSSSDRVNVRVIITLGKKYEITPGISAVYLNNRFFAGASVQYTDKDFFGGGRVFSTKVEALYNSMGNNQLEISFNLFQPFLFRSNLTADFTTSFGIYNFLDDFEYIYTQNLARLSYFIREYTFYNNAYLDITYDHLRLRIKNNIVDDQGNVTPAGKRRSFSNSIVGFSLVHNNTNDLFNPSKGFYHQLTLENAGALPRLIAVFNKSLLFSQYFKFFIPNRFYFDLTGGRRTTIFAFNIEVGNITEYGRGGNIIPVDRIYKFFSGGGNSLRGWAPQTGGILTDPKDGGKFLFEGGYEIRRRPFPQRSFFYPVWIVVFLDWGNVWENIGMFKFNQIALATGLGVRYDTFVGPIRIDFGFKLFNPLADKGNHWLWENPGQIFKNKFAIQFGLGNAF
ncbi:MAG: BamA/TamA family outer membrane protein [Ignavibacteria bacterium]|nr:BamA/TamA family outer membrane protein [Ignavibacteria bacterium]